MVNRLAASRPKAAVESFERLGRRETEVLALVVQGLPNKAIAHHLRISEGTVKAHLHDIFRKLNVESRSAAAALGAQMDLPVPPASGPGA